MAHFDVFISHDNRDFDLLASPLYVILNKVQMNPYIYEYFPQYGGNLPEVIRQIMKMCRVCLVLLTHNGVESFWVHQELGLAFGCEKPIIPVVQMGIDPTKKGFLQLTSHIDYSPTAFPKLSFDVIYALRGVVFGNHNAHFGLQLRCPSGHEDNRYQLPSTEEINNCISNKELFIYNCTTCNSQIRVNPWTFQQEPLG